MLNRHEDNINNNLSSDDEINPKAHKKLLTAVSQIGKSQHIKKPSRSEPVLAQDEFHLVKSTTDTLGKVSQASVNVNDLVKVLNKTSKHLTIGKELRNTKRNKKVLRKPLERPVAERIQRTIGYEKLKKDLSKWDAVVTRNRVAEQQVFPLNFEEIHVNIQENKKAPQLKVKSAFRREFEALEAEIKGKDLLNSKEESDDNEKQQEEILTKEQLIARRKELAYLRIRESQKSAKAHYQNKIKSKRYHKLMKRQKLREQLKEFEILQKENPELALEKLEKLEKNRVLERASLRHKNTGTWAKNLQVRAKYDKDVRKDLAEQIALSRELTEKVKEDNDGDDDDDENDVNGEEIEIKEDNANEEYDPFNPWATVKKKKEVEEFVSGYRKYWMERNKNESELEKYKNDKEDRAEFEAVDDSTNEQSAEVSKNLKMSKEESNSDKDIINTDTEILKSRKKLIKGKPETKSKLTKKTIKKESGWIVEDCTKSKVPKNSAIGSADDDDYRGNIDSKNIDDIFDEAEDFVQEKVAKKLEKLSSTMKSKKYQNPQNNTKKFGKNHLDLSFKSQVLRPEIDEELVETPSNINTKDIVNSEQDSLKFPSKMSNKDLDNIPDKHIDHIDPENIQNIKAKTFQNDLADVMNSGDFLDECNEDDVEVDKQLTLTQVFEDDDFETDFEKERNEERKKNTTEEIDLSLPGWGCWGGCGIPKNRQYKKRFVLKFPKEEKRKDENKEKVYINENVDKKLKTHLVSDLPFPFTSVKDYEASIRAPIGSDFVPETAFRMLTRPSIVTKMGHIIEPMNKDVLVKPPKRPRTVVDARIEELNKKG